MFLDLININYSQKKKTKVALSANDDKTFILNNNVECLTFGHYKIDKLRKK